MSSSSRLFRTERQAIRDARDTFASIIACIDRRVFVSVNGPDSEQIYTLFANDDTAFPLFGGEDIALRVTVLFRVAPVGREYRTTTAAYYYSLDDAGGNEIVSWQWHPFAREEGRRAILHPHLHISAGAGQGLRGEFARAHLVTGRVALEQVLQTAIEDFGVTPADARYRRVFARTLARFRAVRTWAGEYDPDAATPAP